MNAEPMIFKQKLKQSGISITEYGTSPFLN